jgi:hypothetical protein
MRGPMRAHALLLWAMAALVALGVAAPEAQAADTLQDRSVITYEVVPSKHVIHVTEVISLENRKPGTTTHKTCTAYGVDVYGYPYSYRYDCGYTTSYYYYRWMEYVQNDAVHLKAKADRGSATIRKVGKKGKDGWKKVIINHSPLYYGKSRTLTLQYDLPAAGPRATGKRKATWTRASFCAFGPGSDRGRVRIVAPAGFSFLGASAMTQSTKYGKVVLASKELTRKPWQFRACVDGVNPDGVTTTKVTTSAGEVTVVAWKGDRTWSAPVVSAVTEDLSEVAELLGARSTDVPLTIKEGETGSSRDPTTGELRLSQFVTSRQVATDAVVSTWFDRTTFLSDWIKMGYIRWAEATAGVTDLPCTDPGPPPAANAQLRGWTMGDPVAGVDNQGTDLGGWRAQASCFIVKSVNDAIGMERTSAVLATLRRGADAFDPEASRTSRIPSWRDWLDVVTEVGLRPSEADPMLAAELLKRFGVPADGTDVDQHEGARAAYHSLAELAGGTVPAPVLEALRAWDDEAATSLASTAIQAWQRADSVPAIVAGVAPADGVVQRAVLDAASAEELDQALVLADRQVAAATTAAEALAANSAPLDVLQQIGLLGASLPDDASLITAVTDADPVGAVAAAEAIASARAGMREGGIVRAGTGLAVVTLLVVAVASTALLRRRGRRHAVASASGPAGPEEPPHDA